MVFDLTRFPGEDAGALAALNTLDELDHYTYLVAGCVGPFWTSVHVAHRRRLRGWDVAHRNAQAMAFGKALQMANVLRDVAGDLAHGRCYVPARELAAIRLRPVDLREPAPRQRARALYDRLLVRALGHYDDGWNYTLAIPALEWRMRLACAWPLAIGLATLAALAAHPDPMGATSPIKISRAQVRGLLTRSTLVAWSNGGLADLAERLRRRIILPAAGATAVSRVQ